MYRSQCTCHCHEPEYGMHVKHMVACCQPNPKPEVTKNTIEDLTWADDGGTIVVEVEEDPKESERDFNN